MPSDLLCCEVVSGNLRGRLCWQISFVCKIVMGNLRGRLCRQILFMQHGYAAKPRVHTNMVVRKAHMLSMTPMWKDHGRLSRQIFRGSCGYSSEAREALPQNRGCSQAHSRTSEPNRIGSVEAVHEGRKTRRITWSAALAEVDNEDHERTHEYMPAPDSQTDDLDYDYSERRDYSMSPYSSSIHTHGSRPQNYHPSNPQRNLQTNQPNRMLRQRQ
ncbi:unnamed protein product [Microthlaspi erraticum]|uniref:Uncharacterized protein n=1 Tax=Microthlaspi erraticum TaxID=1685480 RepID=A0A6D2KMX6_9BRAS|nr:unnamed protein product [Microthlaspi erraticum]